MKTFHEHTHTVGCMGEQDGDEEYMNEAVKRTMEDYQKLSGMGMVSTVLVHECMCV